MLNQYDWYASLSFYTHYDSEFFIVIIIRVLNSPILLYKFDDTILTFDASNRRQYVCRYRISNRLQ